MRYSPDTAKGIKNDGRQRADGDAAERRGAAVPALVAAAARLRTLEDTLARVSHLAIHIEGHLAELDINPQRVLPSGQGVKAVDALVVFRGP